MRWVVNTLHVRRVILATLLIFGVFIVAACGWFSDEEDNDDVHDVPKEPDMVEIETITERIARNEKAEWAIYIDDERLTRLNPFNYDDVRVTMRITNPQDEQLQLFAFWFHDYTITLNTSWNQPPSGISGVPSTDPLEPQGLEVVQLHGDPHHRVRYMPRTVGTHQYVVDISFEGVQVYSFSGSFEVQSSDTVYRGPLQVEPVHRRNFIFENGETFIPVGQNTGWFTSSTRQTHDYDVWFARMQENHANFARIWMSTWNFALHWGVQHDDFSNRQPAAARLDRVVELAAQYDIHFMLALLNHGQFSAQVNPLWVHNPWNSSNGGPLDYPSQFFTLHAARETYKHQLTYIVARYGYSTHLAAWELWNEVDWTDGFNSAAVYIWHNEMAEHIRSVDPTNKMVTTSYRGHTGAAYQSPHIDFANPHSYDYNNRNMMVQLPGVMNNLFNQYNKPILQSEIGINWQNGRDTTLADPTGISLKQAQWAGVMGGGAGGAMNWWWDSWTHTSDLYYRFQGIGRYAEQMDMTGTQYDRLPALSGVLVNHPHADLLGYRIDDRVYGYAFDTRWHHQNPNSPMKTVSFEIPLSAGTYTLTTFDTDTGDTLATETIIVVDVARFTATFGDDIAFIMTRGDQ